MSDFVQAIVDVCNASAPLTDLLIGGIYDFTAIGRKGINPTSLAQAYTKPPDGSPGQLKPCCVFWDAEEAMDGQAVGMNVRSTQTPIYGRLYDNGNAGYDTLAAAEVIMYGLLNQARIDPANGGLQFLWGRTTKNLRDKLLSDACLYSFNGKMYAIRSS